MVSSDLGPALIALGMAGFLAAVTQAPLTAFIIVMEMVSGHAMVLNLIAGALLASMISRMIPRPLYVSLAEHMVGKAIATSPVDRLRRSSAHAGTPSLGRMAKLGRRQKHRAQHPQECLLQVRALLMGRLQHLGEDGAHGQAEGILPKKAQSALDTWTEPAPHFFTREMQRDLL